VYFIYAYEAFYWYEVVLNKFFICSCTLATLVGFVTLLIYSFNVDITLNSTKRLVYIA